MAGLREIQDGETAKAQPDAAVDEDAVIIGAAVRDRVDERRDPLRGGCRVSAEREKANESAHASAEPGEIHESIAPARGARRASAPLDARARSVRRGRPDEATRRRETVRST